MTTPIFDFKKTIHAALYVAEKIKIKDFHKIFKILYFADREHLAKYGRTITGDTYIKMKDGPVPSNLYDIFKAIRGDSFFSAGSLKDYFSVHEDRYITPERKPDLNYLSQTDIAELDESIAKYGEMPFGTLRAISHNTAWDSAKDNGKISIEDMLREAGEDEGYISYVADFMNCQKAFLQ